MSCLLLASCREADVVLKVTDQVINSDYIGNGAEWDPYDEAIVWEADLSDEDWNELFARVPEQPFAAVCRIAGSDRADRPQAGIPAAGNEPRGKHYRFQVQFARDQQAGHRMQEKTRKNLVDFLQNNEIVNSKSLKKTTTKK